MASALAAMACTTAIFSLTSQAAASPKTGGKPVAVTGAISHIRGTSAELDGTVLPGTQTVSYYFQYGPTAAYGSQTTPGSLPPGGTRVKVGQTVTGLLPGFHYRLVATSLAGSSDGRDKTYTTKSLKVRFTVVKPTEPSIFGGVVTISGNLSGPGNVGRRIELQASHYPYLEPFAVTGAPIVTNAAGAFIFRVSPLATSAQFRVATLDPRPIYSPLVNEQVAVHVTLKVRTSSHKGLVRLYGTVSPAEVGTRVYFQLSKPTRPGGKSEKTTRFSTQFATVVKRATTSMSRFSMIVSVRQRGRYRAYVEIKKGPLVSGGSSTVTLSAGPSTNKR